MPIVCHLSDALLKSFFLTLKVFTGRNFEGRTLRFFAFESLYIPKQNLVFLVSHFENFVLRPKTFRKPKSKFSKILGFQFLFPKIILMITFKIQGILEAPIGYQIKQTAIF